MKCPNDCTNIKFFISLFIFILQVRDKEFKPTVAWLDNFMRRFCLSKKKMGFLSANMLKTKVGCPVIWCLVVANTCTVGRI